MVSHRIAHQDNKWTVLMLVVEVKTRNLVIIDVVVVMSLVVVGGDLVEIWGLLNVNDTVNTEIRGVTKGKLMGSGWC